MFRQRDPFDPNTRAYKQIARKLRNTAIVLLAICVIVVVVGVPCMYHDYVPRNWRGQPFGDVLKTRTEIEYYTLFVGSKPIPRSEIPNQPFFAFLPLRHFVDLDPYRNPISQFLLGKEFFDGPENTARGGRH